MVGEGFEPPKGGAQLIYSQFPLATWIPYRSMPKHLEKPASIIAHAPLPSTFCNYGENTNNVLSSLKLLLQSESLSAMNEVTLRQNIQQRHRFRLRELPDWLRVRLSTSQRFFLLCIIAGVLCGLAAVSFHFAIGWVFNSLFTYALPVAANLADVGTEGWLRFGLIMTLAPALGGLIVGILLNTLAPQAAGSGIPQTKSAYYRNFGLIRFKEGIWRFLLGTVFIGLGNSLGREGPTVHMCSAIASNVGQFFGLARARVQAMVPVGMAAGIAAAFNAPLSAITFVFEELLDDFSTKALGGIVLAVVIAATIERSILGEHPIFPTHLPHFPTSSWMLICLPLGVTSAFLGHSFVAGLLRMRGAIKSWKALPPYLKPALGGLAVGLIGTGVFLLTGQNGVFSIGYDNLKLASDPSAVFWVFLLLFVGKFIATTISYSAGGSGGLFSPILVCGGMLGAMFGAAYCSFFDLPEATSRADVIGACALLGMGTFFASAIRCPFTSILIIFEMTLNYSLILPLMAGNIIAYFLANHWRPVPLYDALLLQDGVNLRTLPSYQGKQDYHHLPVSTIMTYDTVTVRAAWRCSEALEHLSDLKHHGYPILNAHNQLVGCITHHELEENVRNEGDEIIASILERRERKIVSTTPDSSIRDVANTLILQDVMQAPVVSRTEPTRLIGIITLHDIARAQNAMNDALGREQA